MSKDGSQRVQGPRGTRVYCKSYRVEIFYAWGLRSTRLSCLSGPCPCRDAYGNGSSLLVFWGWKFSLRVIQRPLNKVVWRDWTWTGFLWWFYWSEIPRTCFHTLFLCGWLLFRKLIEEHRSSYLLKSQRNWDKAISFSSYCYFCSCT